MNKVHGSGQLRHCFFGTYSAVVGLQFKTAADARDAKATLGGAWADSKKDTVLVWTGSSEELEVLKEQLGSFGADVRKIDSIAKSIDYGEPFECDIPVVAAEQVSLF